MFTVNNEDEAKRLLTLACPTNLRGEHIAVELANEQTMENLGAFSDRLEGVYAKYIKEGD